MKQSEKTIRVKKQIKSCAKKILRIENISYLGVLRLISLILLSLCCCTCSNDKDQPIEVKYVPKGKLLKIESLVYKNTDSMYIGRIRDIEVYQGNIFISEKSSSKIFVFDKSMKYITSIGKHGDGPGEFLDAPYLSKNSDALVAWDRDKAKYILYNNKGVVINEILLAPEYFYTITEPVFLNKKIIIAATKTVVRDIKKELKDDYTTALLLTDDGNIIKRFDKLLPDYTKNSDLTFYNLSATSNIIEGFNNTFFINQQATNKFKQYDKEGKNLKTIEYKPKFYVGPPTVKLGNEPKDMDAWYKKYYNQLTNFSKLVYDKKTNLIYINYRTLHRYQYQTRSFLDADNHLAVLNENNETIYDEKIDGYLAAVDDGILYFLIEESPERVVINKYKIEKKND